MHRSAEAGSGTRQVWFWFNQQLDLRIVAPMFFADPAGAIVGKYCSRKFPKLNPRWIGEKTVLGSAAVMIVTFFTILYPVKLYQRAMLSVAAMLAEAIGGEFDNLVLVLVVFGGYVAIHGTDLRLVPV